MLWWGIFEGLILYTLQYSNCGLYWAIEKYKGHTIESSKSRIDFKSWPVWLVDSLELSNIIRKTAIRLVLSSACNQFLSYINLTSQAVSYDEVLRTSKEDSPQILRLKKKTTFQTKLNMLERLWKAEIYHIT